MKLVAFAWRLAPNLTIRAFHSVPLPTWVTHHWWPMFWPEEWGSAGVIIAVDYNI